MKKEIQVINHRKKSDFLYAYGFGIYSNEQEMQDLFNKVKANGGAKSFEFESNGVDGDNITCYIDGTYIDCIDGEDAKFIYNNESTIAFIYVHADKISRDDERCEEEKLRKVQRKLFLNVEVYYFNEVLSVEKREGIVKREMEEANLKQGRNKKDFRARDIRLIVVLNIFLVIACLGLAAYCYFTEMKGYGLFMLCFAFFFAAWGRKFRKKSK